MRWWKKTRKKIGVFCLLAAALLAGYLLPEMVSTVQDCRVDGSAETAAAQTVQLEMGSDLTLVQKLRVLAEASSEVILTAAQQMEYAEASEQLESELVQFFEEDDLLSARDFSETEHAVRLFVSGEKFVLLWDFTLENEDGDLLQIQMDDDSGRILRLQYVLHEVAASDIYDLLEEKGRNVWDYADELAVRYVNYLRRDGDLAEATGVYYAWAEEPGRIWSEATSDEAEIYGNVSEQEAVAETETAVSAKIPTESSSGEEAWVYDSFSTEIQAEEAGAETWTAFIYFQAGDSEELLDLAVQVSEDMVSVGGMS